MKKIIILIILILAALYFTGNLNKAEDLVENAGENMENIVEDVMHDDEDDDGHMNEGSMMEEDKEHSDHEMVTINTSASVVTWTGSKKIGGSSHTGSTPVSSGSVTYHDEMLEAVEFTLDMAATVGAEGEPKAFIDHLLAGDFFDVANHPTAMFKSTSVTKTESGFDVAGDLTMKGVAKSITAPVALTKGEDMMTYSGSIEINRTDWDITFGSDNFFEDLGDAAIEDMVEISFQIVA